MIRLIFIILLLLLGQAFFIISKERIDFDTGRDELGQLYLQWFGSIYTSGVEITGDIVSIDWFGYNNTLVRPH